MPDETPWWLRGEAVRSLLALGLIGGVIGMVQAYHVDRQKAWLLLFVGFLVAYLYYVWVFRSLI